MKSKHCFYGKKIAFGNFGNYLCTDNYHYKRKIAALLAQGRL